VRFKFRLAKVLTVKEIWERQAKLELFQRTLERQREEDLLKEKAASLDQVWNQLTCEGIRSGGELTEGVDSLAWARQDFEKQQGAFAAAQEAWTRAKEAFLLRRSERRSISKLKEHKRDEYQLALRRKEGKVLDEVAQLLYTAGLRKE
jgi:flagellar export protein FliJ